MKKTLLAGGLMLAGMSLFAQSHHVTDLTKFVKTNHHQLIQSLLSNQTSSHGTALKPTGMKQRVIAQTNRDESMDVVDSVIYKYSGTRGSKFDYNNEDFNYPSYFGSGYFPQNNFWTGGNTMDMLADSISFYYQDPTDLDVSNAYYRTDNKIDSFRNVSSYFDGTSVVFDFEKTYHTFNSQGFLNQYIIVDSTDGTSGYDTNTVGKYYYNTAQNQLLTDTTYFENMGVMMPFIAQSYHYNAQNKLDSIFVYFTNGTSFDLFVKTYIIYNAANAIEKVKAVIYDGSGSGAVTYTSVDSFGYTGTLPFYTFHQQIEWDDMNVETNSGRYVKHVGTNNLPDSTAFSSKDGLGNWQLEYSIKYQYNSENNPTVLTWTHEDGTFESRYNFYYETYDDGNNVGIKDPKANKNFNVYPNPFDNKINIDWKNAATQAKVSLINMMGQTIYTTNKSLLTGNNVINIPATAGGNYILMIQDEKGNTYNQKLSKK